MADFVTTLLDRFVYNVRGKLTIERDVLVDALSSDDEETRQKAETGLVEILGWLLPPQDPAPREERRLAIEEALKVTGMSVGQRQKLAVMASRSTGRNPGRPRTKGPDAVRAFALRLTTEKTWREIATEIVGQCEHFCLGCGDTVRPAARIGGRLRCPKCKSTIREVGKRQHVCDRCADATLDLVKQHEKYLHKNDLYPALPRRKVLDSRTPEELNRL